ncbi:MAG: hypothetical protein OEN02_06220 [Gammaproteobacteria bacterium]|nr:hypothetical protein [Gammaproteobacteria bacterium]MDH3535010.1 hypothetical protein [Gammaproteobacteria bacterium]
MSNLMMPSRVLLYGRVVQGISIDVSVFDAGTGGIPGLGNNRFLRKQFDPSKLDEQDEKAACLAMIYGFEYEAHYYDLMAPTIMLVHGEGMDQSRGRPVVDAATAAAAAVEATTASVVAAAYAATDGPGAANSAAATAAAIAAYGAAAIAAEEAATKPGATPADVVNAAAEAADNTSEADMAAVAAAKAAAAEKGATPDSVAAAAVTAAEQAALASGATPASVAAAAANASAAGPYIGRVEGPFPGFADNVRVWPYDKDDFSMRLDPCSGPIESILLEAEIDDAEMADEMAGRKVSGRKVGGYLGRGRKVSGRKVGISGRKVRGD